MVVSMSPAWTPGKHQGRAVPPTGDGSLARRELVNDGLVPCKTVFCKLLHYFLPVVVV